MSTVPEHVLTAREHAQKASDLTCRADRSDGLPQRFPEALRLRQAAQVHALTSLALSLTGDGQLVTVTYNGSET